MKYSAGNAPPRRLASPKKQVQLELRRGSSPAPQPEEDVALEAKSPFWKWVGLVALFHVLAIGLISLVYEAAPTPPPPPPMWSLLPPGEEVKGTAGVQQASKIGPTTMAPSEAHTTPPPQPTPPEPVTPKPTPPVTVKPPPEIVQPKPVVDNLAPPLDPPKPITPPKPKVKLNPNDLKLADGPTPDPVKHVTKPKPHIKKLAPVTPTHPDVPDRDTASNPDSTGLSKEEVAAALGQKLDASGATNAVKFGPSGAANSHANPFADFYAAIRDQVMSKWDSPNLSDDTAVNPVVQIHVEKDGRVPPESVTLVQSSGNPSYDDSAVAAAKSLGYLHEPLPDGCPPDIPITFKLTR